MVLHVELAYTQKKSNTRSYTTSHSVVNNDAKMNVHVNVDVSNLGKNIEAAIAAKGDNPYSRSYAYTMNEKNANKVAFYEYKYQSQNEEQTNNNYQAFAQLAQIKDVDVVFISKALIGNMSGLVNLGGVDVRNTIKDLNSIEIYSTENKKTAATLKKSIDKIIKEDKYETLMFMKDNDSETAIYQKRGRDSRIVELLVVSVESSEVSIIRMLGKINLNDIKKITKR